MPTLRDKMAAEILAELTKALKSQSAHALPDLHEKIFPKKRGPSRRQEPEKKLARTIDEETAKRFSEFSSRESLHRYLQKEYPEKLSIANLARSISVPVTKADNYESLIDKIIDATVGYRLRSKAIRGRN